MQPSLVKNNALAGLDTGLIGDLDLGAGHLVGA
jgi:hypothetical protein